MSQIDDIGGRLTAARARLAECEARLFRATEARARVATQRLRLQRSFDESRAADRELAAALRGRAAELDTAIAEQQVLREQASATVAELTAAFAAFTDPRENLGVRAADLPFLMFPLRLETRFTKAGGADELLVRVYPDDCLIDSFEDTPAEPELMATDRFWVDWFAAGGDESLRRGAWQAFAAASGHGRAAWLLGQHAPPADATFPVRTDPSDVFLVIVALPSVPAAEQPAVAAYWAAVWRAGADPAARQAADTALDDAVGAGRAAELRAGTVPRNLAAQPIAGADRAKVRVEAGFLELPDRSAADAQRMPWSHPPTVRLLPERFVLLAYRSGVKVVDKLGALIPHPLATGVDPLAAGADQTSSADGEIVLGEPIRWLADFEEAVRIGMGFRITADDVDVAPGFDELLVLGVRMAADPAACKAGVEELFAHHRDGTAGFSVLPQGSATNNVEQAGSSFSAREDPDESYDLVLGGLPPLARSDDWLTRPDGQWLAEMLGVDLATFDRTSGARGRDQVEARAMNIALWPATWGYFLETMLRPLLGAHTVELVRWFFTHLVVGRGTVPAIRIGDQPYGILPTTALSRISLAEVPPAAVLDPPPGAGAFVARLERLLAQVREDWEPLVAAVPTVDSPGDPHQLLLDIVGLHGSSVEFHQRFAESLEELTNRMRLDGFLGQLIAALVAVNYQATGMSVLGRLGHDGTEIPELLEKFFLDDANKLMGTVVDDPPVSETVPVRPSTDDGRNYLRWLIDAARESLDAVRRQEGFTAGKPPTALLFLMLRHAVELGYWDASLRLYEEAGVLSADQLAVARLDPSFVHVASPGGLAERARPAPEPTLSTSGKPVRFDQRSESRYEFLYRPASRITGSDDLLVMDYISRNLGERSATRHLDAQLAALEELADAPTARLGRAFGEHVDLCTYRLDAWRSGLVNYQLAAIRYGGRDEQSVRTGLHLGAFGWLSGVRPEGKVLTEVELPPDLDAIFNPPGPVRPPLVRDSTNGGFIQAPSMNQATTAAILRNGFLANAAPGNPGTLAVNLSAERVRAALGAIEGIRAGQQLGALLGYQLERGLHDRHADAEVDRFIYPLRKAFPLVADHLTDTVSDDADDIALVEARNVVDGFALVDQINRTGATTYPFGATLPSATAAEAAVLNDEVAKIRDLNDAVADLALAEGVFQTVLGNSDRVASTLDAYSHGDFPPEPAVVANPRSGIHLTHRMGLHLVAGLDPDVSPNAVPVTPRSRVEPAVNAWLDEHLPAPADVLCTATYVDATDGVTRTVEVTQADLGLQPIDLLHTLNPQSDQAMTGLDDLVVQHVLATVPARWDTAVQVDHTARVVGRPAYSFFEVGALIAPLRTLLLAARPLTAADISLPNETSADQPDGIVVDPVRLTGPLAGLRALVTAAGAGDDLTTLAADLAALLSDPVTHRADLLDGIDGWLDRLLPLYSAAGFYAVPGAGSGFAYDWKAARFAEVLAAVGTVVERWRDRLARYDDLTTVQLPLAGSDDERFAILRAAEAEIATTATVPLPATTAAYLVALATARQAFAGKLDDLNAITTEPGTPELAALLQRVAAVQPLAAYESIGLDLSAIENEVIRFAGELHARITLLADGITSRADGAQALLDQAAGSSGRTAAQLHLDAAKVLLGDDFRMVWEFTASAGQASELAKAYADRALLLSYLTDPAPAGLELDQPVDDWFAGVARVREPARAWELVVALTGAFRKAEPELTPIQLPYHADDRWLGLDHPADYAFDGERLLYTAHHARPYDPAARQCALLLDEWTEVIPRPAETTGLTFHYDRPNSEPPQVLLLVTSPQPAESWQWEDLVDGVREVFVEARLRAVEPSRLDTTEYAALLPATLSAVTRYPITMMLNLALNNDLTAVLEGGDG